MSKRILILVAAVTALAMMLAGCGPTPEPQVIEKIVTQEVEKVVTQEVEKVVTREVERVVEQPPEVPEKVLTIAIGMEPTTLNPYKTTAAIEESQALPVLEKLAFHTPDSKEVKPWLLESWEFKDPTTIELKLKKGISFTNGEPFNAEAVKFAFEQWFTEPEHADSTAPFKVGDGTKLEIVDDYTLLVTTPQPIPTFESLLGRNLYVIPPKYYSEVGADGFGQAPIGTGPFIFVRHDPDFQVVFEKNPDYWRGAHPIDKVVFRIMPEDVTRTAALEVGEVDIAYYLTYPMIKRLQESPDVVIHSVSGLRKFLVMFNGEMPGGEPLLDKRVRVALNHAVDVETIIEEVYEGQAERLPGQYCLPGEFSCNPDIVAYDYDPEKAKQMLAEAGYPDGFTATYAHTVGRYPGDKQLGEIVASYLTAVGLKLEQRALEPGVFFQERAERRLGHLISYGLLFGPDLADTSAYMVYGKDKGGAPLMTWSDEWLDLFEKSQTETAPAKRAELYHQMIEIEHQDPFGIYLYAPYDFYAVRSRVAGFAARKDQFLLLYDVDIQGE